MKRFCRAILVFLLSFVAIFSFGGCDWEHPKDEFPDLTRNQNVPIETNHIIVSQGWTCPESQDGYYESITLKVTARGYSQLTYYDVEIQVTFTAILITDTAPSGKPFSVTVSCEVDNKGNGEKIITIAQAGCRAINDKASSIRVFGSVTKIADLNG